jgi:hypothetical protein
MYWWVPRAVRGKDGTLGTPGTYVARVASKVYIRKEVGLLQGINEEGLDPTQVDAGIREARQPNSYDNTGK